MTPTDEERDAYAILRPRNRAAFERYLASPGAHVARKLGDDAYIVDTDLSFGAFLDGWGEDELFSTEEKKTFLHDDARGLLIVPASVVLLGKTYDEVVAEASARGLWLELWGTEESDDFASADEVPASEPKNDEPSPDPSDEPKPDPALDALLAGVFGAGDDDDA